MTTATPSNAEQLRDMLGDPEEVAKLVQAGELADKIDDYVSASAEADETIKQQAHEQAQAELAKMLRENNAALPEGINPATVSPLQPQTREERRYKLRNPRAIGAKLDGQFPDITEFFAAIWHRNADVEKYAEARATLRNAFESDVPAAGGFLVPEEFRSELLRVMLETSVVRPLARTIPMGSARVAIPIIDTTSNATTTYGGITTSWTEEAATLTESEPTFGRVVLDAKKLTSYAVVPNELLSDSAISMDALIGELYPESMAFEEDRGFISGSGAGEPLGFTNATAEVAVAKESGQAADTIVYENVVNMYARMLPGSLGRAVWVANINTWPQLATMALSVGTGGSAIWLQDASEPSPMTIFGRPVIFTEKVPTLGDENDINFVDFSYYLIGDRQAMSVSSSEHVQFATDQTAFRIIERVDGRPWIQSAITPATGSTTLSPFVTLAERA